MNIKLPKLEEGKNICVSLSGGLDSTTLVHLLVNTYGKGKVKALGFDYGQNHTIELDMAKKTSNRLGIDFQIIKLDYISDLTKENCSLIKGSLLKPKTAEENSGNPQVNTYVPFRNAQFAFITSMFAETNNCQYIFQGLNCVDVYGYWDTSIDFVKAINNILMLNRVNQIQLITPFVELYKEDELLLAKKLSKIFGYNILEFTWSCYLGTGDKECGKCNTCEEKLKGYILANYSDIDIINKFNITIKELNDLKQLYIYI